MSDERIVSRPKYDVLTRSATSATTELMARRLAPGGCLCEDLRRDGTCKSCGCLNIRWAATLPEVMSRIEETMRRGRAVGPKG